MKGSQLSKTLAPEVIEIIEDLPLSGSDRWYVFLACTGQKRGSWLTLHSDIWRKGDAPKKIDPARIEDIKNSLDKLGLFYHFRYRNQSNAALFQPSEKDKKRQRYNQICDIFIATSQQQADELYEAVESGDHKKIGYALDFPKTAVDEFDIERGPLISWEEIEATQQFDSEVLDATYFMPSKDHYVEEIERVKQWLESLKEQSATIHFELDKKYV